jgi:4-hydroxy-2-oxoheptanedioate aldolase
MIFAMTESFRQKMLGGGVVVGPFVKTTDPAFVEIAGHAGFDFVILDLEHGPASLTEMQNLLRAAECAGILPIIRVADSREISIAKALDIGAKGVQVPNVESAAQAEGVVRAAKYAPSGSRGVCRFVRAAEYSNLERTLYFSRANQNLVIVQVEGLKGIENLDEILRVNGIDIVFIGPYDLSQALGVGGQIDHPAVQAEMRNVIKAAQEKSIVVGTFVDTIENATKWRETGVQYLSYSVDVGIFYEACRSIVARTRGGPTSSRAPAAARHGCCGQREQCSRQETG